ncbi:MAG TPA: flavodoxin family protein [Ktedonobacterales bacterium]|nr:flavodoxin family protein [Ktedonobacterales bacterium]
MNTLIVFDSQFGNTERIAQAIATALRAYGPVRAVRVSRARPAEAKDLDLLVMGCPTQVWQPTEAMVAYVAGITPDHLRGTAVACFDTRFHMPPWLTGSAARILANRLERRGIALVVPPESFFVDGKEGPQETGELERAATWARMIARQIAPSRLVAS